ncbi:MAG: SdpI family protein [Desulfocucumaceae bacterium]
MSANSQKKETVIDEIIKDWPVLLIIIASLVAGVYFYPQLPDQVPSHWNIRGQVDAYSSKFWGAFGIPIMSAAIYILMALLPMIDPRKENYKRFVGAYRYIKLGLAAFFLLLYVTVLLNSLGYGVPVDRIVITGVGLLIMVLGNFMGQLKHNYFVGIKTPWTLASEEVWRKTHLLSSRVWVVAGLVMAVSGVVLGGERGIILIVTAIGASALVPVVYSFIIYRNAGKL